jgi:GNAT superfamily N-acetyltransferase
VVRRLHGGRIRTAPKTCFCSRPDTCAVRCDGPSADGETERLTLRLRDRRDAACTLELIAYELLPDARGHGYATEAARAVLDAAFTTGRRRIWSTVRAWNEPSLRVLRRVGFRRDHVVTDERGEVIYLVHDVGGGEVSPTIPPLS